MADISLRSLSSRGADLSPGSHGSDRADLSLSSGMPGGPGWPGSSLFPNMARRAWVPHRPGRSGRTSCPAHPDRPARTRLSTRTRQTGLPARTRLTGLAARPGRATREQRDLLLTRGARRTSPNQVQRVTTLSHTRVQRSTRLRRGALCIPALIGDRCIGHPSRHGQSDARDQRGAPRPPSDEACTDPSAHRSAKRSTASGRTNQRPSRRPRRRRSRLPLWVFETPKQQPRSRARIGH
jgi:hypothetical protein